MRREPIEEEVEVEVEGRGRAASLTTETVVPVKPAKDAPARV
jgi:hypothetical protein